MGYSTKASFLAAVESFGEACGVQDREHQLDNWRFTEKGESAKVRDIPLEREWIKQVRAELRRA